MNTKFNHRRILGILISVFLFIPFVVSGQNEKVENNEKNDEPVFKYLTFIKFQEAVPLGSFKSDAYRVYFKNSDTLISAAKPGYGYEMGSMFLFAFKPSHEKVYLGLDVSWFEFYYTSINQRNRAESPSQIETSTDNLSGYSTSPYIFFGTKIGMSLSICPVEDLSIDLYYKLNPLISRIGLRESDYFLNGERTSLDIVNSVGLNLRYYYFLFGVEYTSGQLYYESNYLAPNMQLEMLKINLGLYFD